MSSTKTETVSPSLLAMTAPLVISFWMRALFTFVDTVYAAQLGDHSDAAVAAIGLSLPFEFVMVALWVGLSTGLTSNLARAMGARQNDRFEQHIQVTTRLVWACVPLFTLLGVLLWFFGGHLAPDPGSPLGQETARQFAIYGSVLVGGSAFTMFWSVIPDSVVKAHGDTRATMWAGIWSNVINVVLNTVFTFVFHWGVFGIAFSTVLGRFGGLAYALRKAAAHEAGRRASIVPAAPALDPTPYANTLRLAVPATLAYCLMAGENGIVNFLLKGDAHGTEAIAAYAIYYRVLMFVLMPAIAASVAMLPFTARLYGADHRPLIAAGLREVLGVGVVYALVTAPLLYFGAPPLARWLTKAPVAREYATFALRLVPLITLVSLPGLLSRPGFEGMGRGRPGLIVALLRHVVLLAPAALCGLAWARHVGASPLTGLLFGLGVASALSSLISFLWLRRALRV